MKPQYLNILIICILLSGFSQLAFGNDPVFIEGQNKNLKETLRDVTRASGIKFEIPDSLKEFKVGKNIQASDWNDAINQLLENFNLVEVNVEEKTLKKVYILGIKDRDLSLPTVNGRSPHHTKRPLEVSEISLSMDQLRLLAKGPFRGPLPDYLYHLPQLKEYLALYAITTPEDMENIQKAMRVRVEARRQLKLLAEQEKNPQLWNKLN